MRPIATLTTGLTLAALLAGTALAQTPPADAPAPAAAAPAVAPQPATPVEDWHAFSNNVDRVYLADIGTLARTGDVTTLRVARVSRRPTSPTDLSHTIDEFAFRCAAGQVRAGSTVEYGADGTQADRYDDGGDFEAIREDTLDDFAKPYACDGARGNPPSYPSIRAFMDAGRGG